MKNCQSSKGFQTPFLIKNHKITSLITDWMDLCVRPAIFSIFLSLFIPGEFYYHITFQNHLGYYRVSLLSLSEQLLQLSRLSVCPGLCVASITLLPIPAVLSQDFANKNWLVCVKSDEYAFLVTIRPLGS